MSTHRFLFFAISMFGVGCSGSSSLGSDQNPLTNAGSGGTRSAGAGGTAVTAGMGGGADGGTKAGGVTDGSTAGSAGKGTGATGSAGMEPGSGGSGASGGTGGGSGASAGTGGGNADGGTSSMATGGSGGATGGTAGMDMGQAGEGPISVDTPKAVEDPDATGDGPCASKTARDVLEAIHEAYPEFADITDFYDPRYIGVPTLVYPYTSDAGFSLVLARGEGDCPAGCINWDYYYFQTDESCVPKQVGSYSAHSGPCNGYTVRGMPMWGMPDHTPTAICSETI